MPFLKVCPIEQPTTSSSAEDGKGMYKYPSGNVYVGQFSNGTFEGKGTIYFKTGGKYDADWVNGKVVENGKAKYTFSDGLEFEKIMWEYCTGKKDLKANLFRCGPQIL
jgi:hypothetical protein